MTLSNILHILDTKNFKIDSREKQMLEALFGDKDIFDSYIVATKTNIIKALLKDKQCFVIQNDKIFNSSNHIDPNKKFYGLFIGLNGRQILVFPRS